jgi:hypothetical protein
MNITIARFYEGKGRKPPHPKSDDFLKRKSDYMKKYYKKNKGRIRKQQKEYYKRNRDRLKKRRENLECRYPSFSQKYKRLTPTTKKKLLKELKKCNKRKS